MQHSTQSSKAKQLLQHRAQLMRCFPSAPEQRLWVAIRSGKLGVPFRRQVVIGSAIVDFVAARAKLVVEVDGPQHARQRARDARRDRKLERLGYRVLRLEAGMVMRDLPGAVGRVREVLGEDGEHTQPPRHRQPAHHPHARAVDDTERSNAARGSVDC